MKNKTYVANSEELGFYGYEIQAKSYADAKNKLLDLIDLFSSEDVELINEEVEEE